VINVNLAKTGISTWHPVGYFLKNDHGECWAASPPDLGRLAARENSLVSEPLRGRGQGTRLMDAAETLAMQRGATKATLETIPIRPRILQEARLRGVRSA